MGRSTEEDPKEPDKKPRKAPSTGAVHDEKLPGRGMPAEIEVATALRERRRRLLERDALGRTPLFTRRKRDVKRWSGRSSLAFAGPACSRHG